MSLGILLDKVRDLDWKVTGEGNGEYYLEWYSPAGNNFSIIVSSGDDEDTFKNELYDIYNNFDVSEETYLWLDDTGHGKNGAPHDMMDVYKDMQACEQAILDLYDALIDN